MEGRPYSFILVETHFNDYHEFMQDSLFGENGFIWIMPLFDTPGLDVTTERITRSRLVLYSR